MKNIKRVLVTGSNGAVGSDLVPTLLSSRYEVLATDIDCPKDNPFKIEYMDIRRVEDIRKTFKKFKPDCVVHLAAETDVEYCELNKKHAKDTNSKGTLNIAKECSLQNILLVYISSIGVFDGTKKGSYKETDTPHPVNYYGQTKYEGELAVIKNLKKYFILRAGWMMGGFEKDKKFVVKILKLVKKGVKAIDVVNDKSGTPTYTPDLSQIIARIIKTGEYGIYHAVGKGNPTRYEVAQKILEITNRKDIKINKVKSSEIRKVYFAPRPPNETADSSKINKLIPGVVHPWQESLKDYLSNFFGFDVIGNDPKFSIVICLYRPTERFFNDLKKFKKLNYKNLELIIISDEDVQIPKLNFPTQIVLTGKKRTGIGEKRDFGLLAAKGDFIAFIDDDAYPDEDWLKNAQLDFSHPLVGGVGGPNLTPKEDDFWAQVGGLIYESYLTSGGAQRRFVPKEKKTVPELQGVNLILRTNLLRKIGGFSTKVFSGDDTKVSYSIRILGYDLLYDPKVRVYHHRRPFLFEHLRQIRTMGTHRGFFVKKYPETSLYPIYFAPSFLFTIFLFLLIMSFYYKIFLISLIVLTVTLLIVGFFSVIKKAKFAEAVFASIGILLTQLTYGLFFIRGLLFTPEKEIEHI